MTGLLAGLWEFPSLLQEEKSSDIKHKEILSDEINRILGTRCTSSLLQDVGEVGFMSPTDLPHTHTRSLFQCLFNLLSLSVSLFLLLTVCRLFTSSPTSTRRMWFTACVWRTQTYMPAVKMCSGSPDLRCRKLLCPQVWKRCVHFFKFIYRNLFFDSVFAAQQLIQGHHSQNNSFCRSSADVRLNLLAHTQTC